MGQIAHLLLLLRVVAKQPGVLLLVTIIQEFGNFLLHGLVDVLYRIIDLLFGLARQKVDCFEHHASFRCLFD